MLLSPRDFRYADYDGWIFDLDNTIYPASSGLFGQVLGRMTVFIEERFGLDREAATVLQKDLFRRYGTTARGLMEDYDMDPQAFLAYVHDIDLSALAPDPGLDSALGRLPGRKVIFTNGTTRHAMRILEALGIRHHFDYCYDIIEAQHRPKPQPEIYDEMLERTGLVASRAVMVEDMAVNLQPAAARGITTVWLEHALDWQINWGKAELSALKASASYIDYIACDLKHFLDAVD